MKILFMGTPDFAAGILEAICEKPNHEVVAVVTQPDRPKGRSGALVQSPVKEYALSKGIDILQPVRIKEASEIDKLRSYDADIYVVAAFGQILSKEILDIPKNGCINVHASLLPEYRGAAPIQWAIADGKKITGVTIQQMNEGVDTGDIISSSEVRIADDETGGSLFDKLMKEGMKLIIETLDLIETGKAERTPQDESRATYAKILKKDMGLIDWNMNASVIERRIRAFTPWPGGFTYLDNKLIKIKECRPIDKTTDVTGGTITDVTKDEIIVGCSNSLLAISRLQSEGKKEMPVRDFLLGHPLKCGMCFTNTQV